ncbi:MAG: hypothetical protein QOF26_2235 [Baekduia sp.]|nr:hypothetical protein [Baekduia sp.]
MRSLSLPKLLVAATAACALVPAAANAATLQMEGGTLTYRGEGSEGLSLLVSTLEDGSTTYQSFSDSGADRISFDQSICHNPSYSTTVVLCVQNATRPLHIVGSEARDTISIFDAESVPATEPVTIDGQGGDDKIQDAYNIEAGRTLNGGAGNDDIDGYGGDDVIDGGDGNDIVDGGAGNDTVRGGAGDDTMWGDHYKDPGADVLDGGPGTDTIDEWTSSNTPTHPQPAVSLDGAANDGRPGEGDNVTNIEKYTFHINATFTGSDAAETVEILNVNEGQSTLDGGAGNDVLKAYDLNDTVNGGPGDDVVEGGLGNDSVTGGPGKDMIMGDSSASHCTFLGSCKVPFGNDTIYAQDGEADQIDCGIGTDVAYVDSIDTVNNCETVNTAGPVTPAPAGPKAGAGSGAKAGNGAAGSRLALIGAAKVKVLLGGKLAVAVPCTTACRVSVVARMGTRTVATGRTTLLKAGTAKVKLKVAKKARRSLKHSKSAKITLTATITGASGKPQTLTKALTLK